MDFFLNRTRCYRIGPNKKYNFRIRAENQYGISDAMELDEPITAKFPFTVPDPPTKPKTQPERTSAVNVQWERPYSDGGSKIQGYKVEYRETSDANWIAGHGSLIKSQTYTVTGLVTGCTYEFQIKATNVAGPPGTPFTSKVGKNYVDLKWTVPFTDGGSRITGYILEGRNAGGSWFRLNDYNVTDLTYTALDLTTNADYEFRVIAVNAVGKSEPSLNSNSVKVNEDANGVLPEFIKGLYNTSVGLGKRLELTAEVSGKPT